MAEIVKKNTNRSHGQKKRIKRKTTNIDMTAMVDVAFLLLTFFVLSSQLLNQQQLIELSMPPKGNEDTPATIEINEERILNFLLSSEGTFSYTGVPDPTKIKAHKFSQLSIRNAIQEHLTDPFGRPICKGRQTNDQCWDPIIVVKAEGSSKYHQLVDLLDEFEICGAKKYAIAPFEQEDKHLLKIAERDKLAEK